MLRILRLLSILGFAFVLASGAFAETVSPKQAAYHVGEMVSVEGVVSQVSRSDGGTIFINFGGRYPNHVFYAVVFRSNAGKFPGVHNLEGRRVVVSGTIKLYKGKPQIILNSPDQISVR